MKKIMVIAVLAGLALKAAHSEQVESATQASGVWYRTPDINIQIHNDTDQQAVFSLQGIDVIKNPRLIGDLCSFYYVSYDRYLQPGSTAEVNKRKLDLYYSPHTWRTRQTISLHLNVDRKELDPIEIDVTKAYTIKLSDGTAVVSK